MKPSQLIGSILLISGTILFGITHLAVANYIPDMGVYDDPPGRFFTALNSIGAWAPYILSIVFMIVGLLSLLIKWPLRT